MAKGINIPVNQQHVSSDSDPIASNLIDAFDEGTAITITPVTIGIDEKIRISYDGSGFGFGSFNDNRIIRADGASALQDSGVTLDDTNNITGVNDLTVDGEIYGGSGASDSLELKANSNGTPSSSNIFFGNSLGNNSVYDAQVARWGFGITSVNETATVGGRISMLSINAPSATASYGKIWVEATDSDIPHYMFPSGSGGSNQQIVLRTQAQTLANKTLTTPTIASFTNATHNHENAAGGGTISILNATTGTLSIARGGTGQTTQTAAFDALAPGTTKGDLLVHGASNHERLAVGSNAEALVADSGESTGARWAGVGSPVGFSGAGRVCAAGSTIYLAPFTGALGSEANIEFYVARAGTVRNLRCYVSANSITGFNSTVTIRKNGGDTSLTVTYTAGTTGLQTDLSNSFTVAAGDRICVKLACGGFTGSLALQTCTMELVP